MTGPDPLLRIDALTKSFPDAGRSIEVLRGVSLSLGRGESLALSGESGSGKSTLLHIVAGLEPADAGRVEVDGTDIAALDERGRAHLRRATVAVVFQQFNLVPSLSVRANIALQARLAGRHDPALCDSLAERMGVSDQLAKFPEALSGGQQQRVAIARALAARPKLLLADEPTGNLDEARADAVLDLMLGAAQDTGTALLMVTHSARHAGRLGRQVHLRQGRIAA